MDQNGSPTSGSSQIIAASAHLRAAEQLLVNPNRNAMEQAGFVLQKAQSLLETCEKGSEFLLAADELQEFEQLCARIKALLEGAIRVQWTYIHRIGSVSQTYTSKPGIQTWTPSASTIALHA